MELSRGQKMKLADVTSARRLVAGLGAEMELKKKVAVVLEKKALTGVRARVGLVIDTSGSMKQLYAKGVVQETVERVLAVAARLDDDGTLDVWFYADRFARVEPAREATFEGYVARARPVYGTIGYGNNEPPVMQDVLKKYAEEDRSPLPAFVVFLTDGGVRSGKAMEKILVAAAGKPIFWQFVGLGRAQYGILEKLDTMPGRVVDNASFFALDDIATVSDEELYERLLHEFPSWLRAARTAGILPAG